MEANILVEEKVSSVVSQIIADHLEVDVAHVRSCTSFAELHPDFDSLAVLEIQNLVEEHFGTLLAFDAKQDTFPMCLRDLVTLVIHCLPEGPVTGATISGRAS